MGVGGVGDRFVNCFVNNFIKSFRGQGQGPFIGVLLFLLALGIANILALIRLIRLRFMRPG